MASGTTSYSLDEVGNLISIKVLSGSRPSWTLTTALLVAAVTGGAAFQEAHAQGSYATGQNIAPAYEGWERNPDGSFTLVFGYMNRNWAEEIDLPIGPDNSIEPGGPDRGQPTHFLPRRNRFVFRIRVPADFGDNEVVWTLTSHGTTERAYATLKPDYFIDELVIMANNGAGGGAGTGPQFDENTPPVLEVEGDLTRTVTVGQRVTLAASVSDDDLPKRRSVAAVDPAKPGRFTVSSATGLRLSWYVYRGAGAVVFDPPQIKVWEDTRESTNSPWAPGWKTPDAPRDGRWVVHATFSEPGTYVLRCLAHDGGLMTSEDLTFLVTP